MTSVLNLSFKSCWSTKRIERGGMLSGVTDTEAILLHPGSQKCFFFVTEVTIGSGYCYHDNKVHRDTLHRYKVKLRIPA